MNSVERWHPDHRVVVPSMSFIRICNDHDLDYDALVNIIFYDKGTPGDREKVALVMSLWALAKAAEP